jgi:Spy/CpxP family protein refolding chaperone
MSETIDRRANRFAAMALAAALALPAALPSIASAQTPPPPVTASPPPAKAGVNFAAAGMGIFEKLMTKADATPDQRAKIKAILMGAVMSLPAQAPALKATISSFGASLTATQVDRAGLESARVSAVAEFDTFSKVLVKAIGEVLTPEQRAKLAASSKPKG